MYKIGDKILYGAVGIMEIIDIESGELFGTEKNYYVLREVFTSSDSKTYVPCDNERLVMQMHPLKSKDEILSLLDLVSAAPEIEWETNNRLRSEQYRRIMESGDRLSFISMIKSVLKMGEARAKEGKKNYIADDTAMRRAVRLLSLEISLSLNISESEAESLLFSKIN